MRCRRCRNEAESLVNHAWDLIARPAQFRILVVISFAPEGLSDTHEILGMRSARVLYLLLLCFFIFFYDFCHWGPCPPFPFPWLTVPYDINPKHKDIDYGNMTKISFLTILVFSPPLLPYLSCSTPNSLNTWIFSVEGQSQWFSSRQAG